MHTFVLQAIKKALPAVTSSTTSGEGLSWLSDMISACDNACEADYINLVRARPCRASSILSLTSGYLVSCYLALVRVCIQMSFSYYQASMTDESY